MDIPPSLCRGTSRHKSRLFASFQRKQVYHGLLASNTFNHRQQQMDSSPLIYFRKPKTEMVLVRPAQER